LGEGRLSSLLGRGERDYKTKIATAMREIDLQRRELENLKGRLSDRRQRLFEFTVRALQERNKSKANVYANEHTELRKVIKIVEASELALTQVSLRLQSITEIGDAMLHMGAAFKSLKSVSKTMEGFVPALDATSTSINDTLAETMSQLGQLSPTINVDVHNENAEQLVEQARKFAEEQSERLRESLHVIPSRFEQEIHNTEEHVPILATGEEGEEESPVLGTIFSSPNDGRVENEVLRYASSQNGVIDISETSVKLGIPADEVEHSMIRLMAQGKVRSPRSES
jgi:division protein CdvB (Snf7/Vps24/ESCRT-III family)